MRKFLLLITFSLALFGFDTNKLSTTIIKTNKTNALINKNITYGMTGYVIQNNMIIAKVVSLGNKNIKYLPLVKLKNTALASPNVSPKKNDKVIFGLYNFRGLLIAPSQNTYMNIQKKYPNVNFISSDIFATYFDTKPSVENFQKFCRSFNVGFVDFILDKEYIVDCESFVVLDTKNIKAKEKYKKAFFVNYKKFSTSLFSSTPDNWIKYYKSLFKKVK